jgi:hypothetical protein
MEELTAYELNALYSLAAKEARADMSEVTKDELVYKQFVKFWDTLADKLRVMHEKA